MTHAIRHREMNCSVIRRDYYNRVVAGRQLFPFDVYDYKTYGKPCVVCQMCRSCNITSYIEAMGLDLAPIWDEFCRNADLTKSEAKHFVSQLYRSDTIVNFCRDCGFWFTEYFEPASDEDEIDQHIIQMTGCIAKFSAGEEIPSEELATHIALRRANLGDISPQRFERMVGEFLKAEWQDAEVHHVGCVGGDGDGGVDFLLITSDRDYLVQVKHRADPDKKEGVKFIRELNGAILREASRGGVFVTSATGYTTAAKREVEQTRDRNPYYDFFMLDRLDLKKWIMDRESNDPWRSFLRDVGREEAGLTFLLREKLKNEEREISPCRNLDPDGAYEGNISVYR